MITAFTPVVFSIAFMQRARKRFSTRDFRSSENDHKCKGGSIVMLICLSLRRKLALSKYVIDRLYGTLTEQ